MKTIIARDGCIGCGFCTQVCPAVFAMADDGLATVIADPTQETFTRVKEAAAGCPVMVITIEA